jgi:hypothetical protein
LVIGDVFADIAPARRGLNVVTKQVAGDVGASSLQFGRQSMSAACNRAEVGTWLHNR